MVFMSMHLLPGGLCLGDLPILHCNTPISSAVTPAPSTLQSDQRKVSRRVRRIFRRSAGAGVGRRPARPASWYTRPQTDRQRRRRKRSVPPRPVLTYTYYIKFIMEVAVHHLFGLRISWSSKIKAMPSTLGHATLSRRLLWSAPFQ